VVPPDVVAWSVQIQQGSGEEVKTSKLSNMAEIPGRHHPSPSIPLPVEGRGKPESARQFQSHSNLRARA
jgi:hypothetical protein